MGAAKNGRAFVLHLMYLCSHECRKLCLYSPLRQAVSTNKQGDNGEDGSGAATNLHFDGVTLIKNHQS